jgi:hypothetical protein
MLSATSQPLRGWSVELRLCFEVTAGAQVIRMFIQHAVRDQFSVQCRSTDSQVPVTVRRSVAPRVTNNTDYCKLHRISNTLHTHK